MEPTAYRSPLLARPGAVEADPPDSGVASHYGDPFREQRTLADGQGFVDLSHRGVVTVSGPDRLTWLHSLTSQQLEGLPAGEGTEALILSPHGHVEHALYLVDDGETTWVHVEPQAAPGLVEFLDRMRFLMRVGVADVTEAYAVVWEPVPASSVPEPAYVHRADARGRDLFVPRGRLEAYADARQEPAGIWAYEALRVEARRPRLGLDTDPRTIPNEVGWIDSAVHLDKGCYRGQETVARVHNLGRPPRRLVFLHLDGSAERLPAQGDPVERDGRTVGFVGTAVRHHELGPIALAMVKRNVPPEAELTAAGVGASQEVVVDPEVGLHVRR
ncbi:MAG: YgfZ/GcvT domain-containing protein [Actinomycetes bacterium]